MQALHTLLGRVARRYDGAGAYGLLVLASVLAAGLDWALEPLLDESLALVLFTSIVCGSAMLGGRLIGLAATCLGLFWLALLNSSHVSAAVLAMFAIAGVAISFSGQWVLDQRLMGERAAKVLAEREAQLRSIFDTAPDALIVIDEAGAIQSYSAAAERMFGWTASEAFGRNINMLMPSPYREAHDGYVQRYLKTGERRIIGIGRIVVGERKDGTTFPMELAVGEVRSERGRLFTGFVRDLSERQAREARLQELQTDLMHMSRLSAMGEMASALAHELNQPLSAAANFLSGARRLIGQSETVDPRALDALDKANAQTLRAGEVIRRLRDFLARGDSDRRVESLSKIVREACALALVGAKEHGVRVRYEMDESVDRVMVDRVPIQQVVINLVRNAMDAMEQSPRRELVVTTCKAESGVVVGVSDTGPGVSEEAAGKLFQPFMTTKPNGMGVGLSISRTIVEAHGGRIWVEPNPGGGAAFKFSLSTTGEGVAHAG
ncbi:MAG: PAS domain S-box protein [Hyphomonadaceae bacterium]|nr:PAS domain S-box protein [Hyphomonadaceae bacterium]